MTDQCMVVTFADEEISLDLNEEGITMEDGWSVKPTIYTTVSYFKFYSIFYVYNYD